MHVYVDSNYNHHTLPICKEVMINTHLKTCSHKYSVVINFSVFSQDLGLQSCLPFILIDTELKHQIHSLSSERRLGKWMELLCTYHIWVKNSNITVPIFSQAKHYPFFFLAVSICTLIWVHIAQRHAFSWIYLFIFVFLRLMGHGQGVREPISKGCARFGVE